MLVCLFSYVNSPPPTHTIFVNNLTILIFILQITFHPEIDTYSVSHAKHYTFTSMDGAVGPLWIHEGDSLRSSAHAQIEII